MLSISCGEKKNWLYHLIKYKFIRVPWGKQAFVLKLPEKARILDVGCGNNSPLGTKKWRPDIEYYGIDVGDYNNSEESLKHADRYMIAAPSEFAETIRSIEVKFDAVISNHNIEHCNQPVETLRAVCAVLKQGGKLYLAFPCEKSVSFPSRKGTLNFYDDPTHIWLPSYKDVLKILKKNNMKIIFARQQYKPVYSWLWGGVLENRSRKMNKVLKGTWGFWGFETVIWAEKINS